MLVSALIFQNNWKNDMKKNYIKLIIVIIFALFFITPAIAENKIDFDFSKMEGDWMFVTLVSSFVKSTPLTLKWDGKKLTGQTSWQNYKKKTFHHIFKHWSVDRIGRIVVAVDIAANPMTLTGKLSEDGSFMRGDCKIAFSNGSFILNRITKHSLPNISGTYDFNYQLIGIKKLRGMLHLLCDNSGKVNGFLKLPKEEYSICIKGVFSKEGELQFYGWSHGKKMICKTKFTKKGIFDKGTWTTGKKGGFFQLILRN